MTYERARAQRDRLRVALEKIQGECFDLVNEDRTPDRQTLKRWLEQSLNTLRIVDELER